MCIRDRPQIVPATAVPVMGKPIKAAPTPLRNLTSDYNTVTVWGDVLGIEFKETKDQKKYIITIQITDYTNSTSVKVITDKEKAKPLEEISPGTALLVGGNYSFDTFDREYSIRARDISTVEKIRIVDDAPKKRVELHLHTNMSALDALTPAGKLVEQAWKWGHPAIAITDHGVAQAFPDAMNAAADIKKKGGEIKIIYGTEAYFVNNMVPVVENAPDLPLDSEYIVFDLETTGLGASTERMTEIGAVRLKNGAVAEVFNTFVDPEKKIPPKITELTGITNEMVQGAPKEEEALRQFMAFCGKDPVLVAHNAPFDTSFLRAAAKRHEISFPFSSIDTVPLSRALLHDLKNYKLDTVAKADVYKRQT